MTPNIFKNAKKSHLAQKSYGSTFCDMSHHTIRCGPNFPSPKGARTAPQFFVQCPLWPNDRMDEDATCYGSRPRPRPHCIRRGPSSARQAHSSPPSFRSISIVGHLWQRSPISATAELLYKRSPKKRRYSPSNQATPAFINAR